MPRISSRLILEAAQFSRLLPPLLRANRTLSQAKKELEWIQKELPKNQWADAVKRRSKLEPLQYILGTQPFGPLDILCKKDVLIPRWETEEWTSRLGELLRLKCHSNSLSIIDACTGSGCIPLLLDYKLSKPNIKLDITGFDVSNSALSLSMENLQSYRMNFNAMSRNIKFIKADLFKINTTKNFSSIDLVISNPPYIPKRDYLLPVALNGIEKSVRLYEPRLALIGENEFYEALVKNLVIPLHAKGFVYEIGYIEQAQYVVQLLRQIEADAWNFGVLKDTNENIRCIVGWQKNSFLEILKGLCDYEI